MCAKPLYSLRNICRVVSMPKLVASVDVATKLTGVEKVPPLVEAEISAEAYTRTNFDLWKNVAHVVVSDEAAKKAAHDIINLQIADAAKEIARMENSQIKAVAEAATAVAGSDWGDSTKNPFDDIGSVMDVIEGNGFPVDFIAADPLVWLDFFSNTFTRGTAAGVQIPSGKTFPIPGLPGVTGISDTVLTNTIAIVGSLAAPAIILGDGPTEAARYRDEGKGYTGFIIRQWLQPILVQTGAIRRLTGVHA